MHKKYKKYPCTQTNKMNYNLIKNTQKKHNLQETETNGGSDNINNFNESIINGHNDDNEDVEENKLINKKVNEHKGNSSNERDAKPMNNTSDYRSNPMNGGKGIGTNYDSKIAGNNNLEIELSGKKALKKKLEVIDQYIVQRPLRYNVPLSIINNIKYQNNYKTITQKKQSPHQNYTVNLI